LTFKEDTLIVDAFMVDPFNVEYEPFVTFNVLPVKEENRDEFIFKELTLIVEPVRLEPVMDEKISLFTFKEETLIVEVVRVEPVMVENMELFIFTAFMLMVETDSVDPVMLEKVVLFTPNRVIYAVDVVIVLP